jgi:O6-methylguanine-DNA--protein-cysteine methyltransferase
MIVAGMTISPVERLGGERRLWREHHRHDHEGGGDRRDGPDQQASRFAGAGPVQQGELVGHARPGGRALVVVVAHVVAGRLDGIDEDVAIGEVRLEIDRCGLGREVDAGSFDARGLREEALDAVHARRARHALDRQVDMHGLGRHGHTPWEYTSRGVWDTRRMDPRGSVWVAVDGPSGPLHIAATARGIVAVEQLTTDQAFVDSLRRRGKGPVEPAADVAPDDPRRRRLDAGIAALEMFVAGRPARNRPLLDLDDRPDWDRRVLTAVSEIPWGRTASYGEIARTRRDAAGGSGRRRRGRAQPDQPAHPMPPGHRLGRHARGLRQRRLGLG